MKNFTCEPKPERRFIFVYIANQNEQEAETIANLLLENHLIACANLFPVKSFYRWEGKIQNDKEYVLIVKTFDECYAKIVELVTKNHSYEIPCIIKLNACSNKVFFDWAEKEIKN